MTLQDYITGRLGVPFAWGTNDCICFVVGWVEIATGKKHLERYLPWENEREAWKIIARLGGLEQEFDKYLRRVPPNFARDGDVALVGKCAYIFSGSHIVSVGTNGLVFKSRLEATCAWSY